MLQSKLAVTWQHGVFYTESYFFGVTSLQLHGLFLISMNVLIRCLNCKETHLSPHLALEREQLFLHGGDGTPKALVLVITSCVCTWGKEKEGHLKVGNRGSGF